MLGRITIALFFLLLVWGNLVAGMKAGLACPDWPLCRGEILPPFRLDIWMEFTHRLIAAVAAICLIILARQRFRSYSGVARAVPLAALALIGVEVAIGGIVVMLELPVQLTTLHFMTGTAIFLLVVYMGLCDGAKTPPPFSLRGYAGLFAGFGALVFSQAALGAYVRHSGSGLACPDFPTCRGSWLPGLWDAPVMFNYSHRLLALGILVTTAVLCCAALLDRRLMKERGRVLALFILAIAQTGIGAGVVHSGLNYMATALHLGVALGMLSLITSIWLDKAGEMGGAS